MTSIKTKLIIINSIIHILFIKNLSLTPQNLKEMFFVGATGQLLTLILTVCLPFVFLFSAQPKTEILKETLLFEHHQNNQQVTSLENETFQIHFNSVENLQNIFIEFEDSFFQKVPPEKVRVKWKSFYAESSGNKAPPFFNYLSC